MDKRLHNSHGFLYKVFWRKADSLHWNHQDVTSPPFMVNNTGTYTPFEIKVQAVNSLGEGPAPEPEIGHSGEEGTLSELYGSFLPEQHRVIVSYFFTLSKKTYNTILQHTNMKINKSTVNTQSHSLN